MTDYQELGDPCWNVIRCVSRRPKTGPVHRRLSICLGVRHHITNILLYPRVTNLQQLRVIDPAIISPSSLRCYRSEIDPETFRKLLLGPRHSSAPDPRAPPCAVAALTAPALNRAAALSAAAR